MIRRHSPGRRQRGFSLVEALVALVVLSVGLLGVAALYTWSLRDSRTALLRSEAVNLASDMADRIRANRIAGPEYDEGAAGAGEIVAACTDAGCTPEEMAAHDKAEWLEALANTLPAGEGTVDVDDATEPFTYTITVDWVEPSLGPQTYVLRFQGMSARTVYRRRQQGFGLVELMVALAIGAVLVYGAVRLLMDTSNSRRTNDAATRVQEVARYAMSVIEPDLRMTSFWGRTNHAEFVTNAALPTAASTAVDDAIADNCGTNWASNVTAYVEARDGGYDLDCDGESPTAYSDVLVVRHASAEPAALTDGVVQIQAGRMRAELFTDGTVPAGYAAAPATVTHDLVVNAYYVGELGDDVNGQPQWALRRKRLASVGGAPAIIDEEIVRGVQDLQVQFGFDTSGDGAADVYVNPGDEPADAIAVAARVFLLVVAEDRESGFKNETAYTLANQAHDSFGDERRRIVVMKTIQLRNPQN